VKFLEKSVIDRVGQTAIIPLIPQVYRGGVLTYYCKTRLLSDNRLEFLFINRVKK